MRTVDVFGSMTGVWPGGSPSKPRGNLRSGDDCVVVGPGWDTGGAMSEETQANHAKTEPIKTLPLVFDAPRGRKKPPRHLADLDEAGRKRSEERREGKERVSTRIARGATTH